MNGAAPTRTTPRAWLWLQLAIAWLPMWALFTAAIVIVHGVGLHSAAIGALRTVVPGALLGVAVYEFAVHLPWPHPFRLRFVAAHSLGGVAFACVWYVLVSAIDSVVVGRLIWMIGPGFGPFLLMGLWLYVIIAGGAYANLAAQRSARIEAEAARAQLEALRAQLHPHFLFNALHTVVQLIPADPRAAVQAAEHLAAALRSAVEERRDLVPLREEWAFVERYLLLERIRFGARLVVHDSIEPAALDALVPSFALQTLVENAIRHGAAPRIAPTRVTIDARRKRGMLRLTVRDDGAGAGSDAAASGGSGLRRLRERMRWLYGEAAHLDIATTPGAGFTATLRIPLRTHDDD